MPTTIGGAAITTPSSNMGVGTTGTKWISYMAAANYLDPNFAPTNFQKYGKPNGVYMRDLLRARGAEMNLPMRAANDLKVVEELNYERPIILRDSVTAAAAGTAYTFYLSSDCYQTDADGNHVAAPCQKDDVIMVPAQFLQSGENQSAQYLVTAVADDALVGDKLTVAPLAGTNSKIDATIPAGTPMAIANNLYADGEGQPKGKNTFPVDYSYKFATIKSTYALQEHVLAQKMIIPEYNGNRYLVNKETARMERDLEIKEDWVFFTGQKNNNTSVLVGTGMDDQSSAKRSCDGMYTLMNDMSMNGYYDTSFGPEHLDATNDGFISQQVNAQSAAIYAGHSFYNGFCDLLNDHLREYSATDLYDPMKGMLGITPKVYNWKGVDYYIQPLQSLDRPSTTGLAVNGEKIYEYSDMAMMIADNPITVVKFGDQVNASIPNVGIGYINYNGENRGKVFGILKGMTNIEGGVQVASDKGGVWYYLSSSPYLWGAAWNQKYLWRKTKVAA